MLPVIATIIVFMVVVYVQALKVEIPLAFGSIRGFSRRWPLKLLYTSNIPVILVAALIANVQLVGTMLAKPTGVGRCGLLGCFDENGFASSGFVYFLQAPSSLPVQVFFLLFMALVTSAALVLYYFRLKNLTRLMLLTSVIGFAVSLLFTNFLVGLPTGTDTLRVITYLLVLVGGATVFSIFWVSTSGMDAKSVAEQIEGMGMQVPGFRRDPRIIEQVLGRYIPTLAIISGIAIGTLAALADFTSAVGTGTGILLTVMIIYNFYEQISARYMEDMHPAMRKFFE
jgi:preprotein translocase subunit SecY